MAKSSKPSVKKIKGPFEKYNLFEKMDIQDNCWEVDGVKVVGPGAFCWIFIFIIIFQYIISLININDSSKLDEVTVKLLSDMV